MVFSASPQLYCSDTGKGIMAEISFPALICMRKPSQGHFHLPPSSPSLWMMKAKEAERNEMGPVCLWSEQ